MKTQLVSNQKINLGEVYGRAKGNLLSGVTLSLNNMIMLLISFLLGRVNLFEGFMPFGLAFYAAASVITGKRFLTAAAVLLGMITGGAREELYTGFFFLLLFNAASYLAKLKKIDFKLAAVGFGAILLPKMTMVYFEGFLVFDFLCALFYSFLIFSLIFVFGKSAGIIDNLKTRHVLSNEEMISFALVVAVSVAGLNDIPVPGINLTNAIGVLGVMLLSFRAGPGVGAAAGVITGIVVNMSDHQAPYVIGAYAFCGLMSGVFRNLGKAGAALAFIAGNALLTIYINGSTEVLIYLKDMLLASIVFMLIPQKYVEGILGTVSGIKGPELGKASYSTRIKQLTIERLNKFSRAFEELAKTFTEISKTREPTNKQDISVLFDRVADKVCKDCSLCLHCWDRNFYNTYQVMFKVVEALEEKGWISEEDIPAYFLDKCERIADFVRQVNNVYEIFKVDLVWKNRVGESRGLVSQQLDGISKVISNLALEIDDKVKFRSDIEDILMAELDKAGIKTNDVLVFENKWGKYEITVFHKGPVERSSCMNTIEKIVSDTVGRRMAEAKGEYYSSEINGAYGIKLLEEETYSITTGIARLPKYGRDISGDNYTFMETGDGQYILALSDGMGSGYKASMQSKVAISLLEHFMETGFDKDTAIKLINSILVLKSEDDSFATIDLTAVDLYDGKVEFVKIGAVPTFIKKGNSVEVVKMVSLPAGILSNIETELVSKSAGNGDFIIMVTDGIIDAFKNEDGGEQDLIGFIEDIKSLNPQGVAELILGEAYARSGEKPSDDMTVLAAKIWKRN